MMMMDLMLEIRLENIFVRVIIHFQQRFVISSSIINTFPEVVTAVGLLKSFN